MVRVNGKESVALLTNMYPDMSTGQDVLHLHVDAPVSETVLWKTNGHLDIEADWRQEFGGVMYASQQGLADILACCSAQGRFLAHAEDSLADGRLFVALQSLGALKPWERQSCMGA